jgi:thiol-disulfide isomerase/thioredoxin
VWVGPCHDQVGAAEMRPRQLLRRRLILVAVVIVAIGAFAVWRGLHWTAPAETARAGQADTAARSGLTLYPAGARTAAPDIRGATLTGGQLALADLRGEVVVVNVWGSWCNPCRAETPDLVRVAAATKAQEVRFVGIDTRDNPDAARAFVRAFKVPYPSIIDRDGNVLLNFNGIIPAYAVPSTLVIDPAGKIAARMIGRIGYSTLLGIVHDILAETSTVTPAATPAAWVLTWPTPPT